MKNFLKLFVVATLVVGCARTISDLVLKIGNGTDNDVKIEAEIGKGVSNSYINYNTTNDKWEFCNEGVACEEMGTGGGTGIPLLAKGSILTSNGTANGEFAACADGEILEFDAAEISGIKCVTPSAGGGTLVSGIATFARHDGAINFCYTGVCNMLMQEGDFNISVSYSSQGTYSITAPAATFEANSYVYCDGTGNQPGFDRYVFEWNNQTLKANASGGLSVLGYSQGANVLGTIKCSGKGF